MAESSFFTDMVIDTPEAVANLEKAFKRREREGPFRPRSSKFVIRRATKEEIQQFINDYCEKNGIE